MKRVLVVAVAVLALTGCASSPAPKPTPTTLPGFSATGTITTPASMFYFPPGADEHTIGDECVASENYDDVAYKSQVIITDSAGETVGVGDLGVGILTAPPGAESMVDTTCVFTFGVDIKADSDFYGVQAGSEARGVVQYSVAQMKAGVDLTLAD